MVDVISGLAMLHCRIDFSGIMYSKLYHETFIMSSINRNIMTQTLNALHVFNTVTDKLDIRRQHSDMLYVEGSSQKTCREGIVTIPM